MPIQLVEEPEFPAKDDVIGQVAVALAIHDVTEPPKALTREELDAFEKLFHFVWGNFPEKHLLLEQLQDFRAREKSARNKGYSSFPLHYGMHYWRDYIEEAKIAIKTAQMVLGRNKLAEKREER